LHAAVVFAVEVEGGRIRLDGERRLQASLQVVAVVPQRCATAAGSAERLEDVAEVLAGVKARRPVAPELRDDPIQAALSSR
jgi:hypothetical protein